MIYDFLWSKINDAPSFVRKRWQLHCLRRLLDDASTIRAYREILDQIGISPSRMTLGDFKTFPLCDRSFFKNRQALEYLANDRVIGEEAVRFFCDSLGRPIRFFEDVVFLWRKEVLSRHTKQENIFLLPEFGPVAEQCPTREGYHFYEQSFLAEVVDGSGQSLPSGQEGELVLTYFDNHYMPFIRYVTDKRGYFKSAKCRCGKEIFVPRFGRHSFIFLRNEVFYKYQFDSFFRFYYGLIDRYEVHQISQDIIRLYIHRGVLWDDFLRSKVNEHLKELLGLEPEVIYK